MARRSLGHEPMSPQLERERAELVRHVVARLCSKQGPTLTPAGEARRLIERGGIGPWMAHSIVEAFETFSRMHQRSRR